MSREAVEQVKIRSQRTLRGANILENATMRLISASFYRTIFNPKPSSQHLQRTFSSKAKMAAAASANPSPSITAPLKTSHVNSQVQIPRFVYGTAWKKDRTRDLVFEALCAGFKGVDTAAQPRHYREELVGAGVRKALGDDIIKREDIHVQPPPLATFPILNPPS